MDGGRGGRGKGKKGKAAKKKGAAASQAAGNQKKVATTHGAKKVGANHSNVQVVAVSGALEAPNSMTKSKRKRLKKQAAAEALKASQMQKSPTAASPKTKVGVLTPPATKPQVVSLTGKKKKRKRNAALVTESGDTNTDGQLSEGSKSPKTKTVGSTVTSPKRNFTQKSESGSTSDVSIKTDVVLNPRETVKMKAKPVAVATKPDGNKSSIVLSEEKAQVQVQQLEKLATIIPGQVTKQEMGDIGQINSTTKNGSSDLSLQTAERVTIEKHDTAVATSSKAEAVIIPPKMVKTKKKTATSSAPTVNDEDKLLPPTALAVTTITPDTLSKPLKVAPPALAAASGSNVGTDKTSPRSVQSIRTSAASTRLPAADTTASSPNPASSPNLAEAKLATSPLVETKAFNPSLPVPRSGIKRQRPTDQASMSSGVDPLQPPVKRNAAASEDAGIQPSSEEAQISSDKPSVSGLELPTSSRIQLQHVTPTAKRPPGEALVDESQMSAQAEKVVASPSVKSPPSVSYSAARGASDKKKHGNLAQLGDNKSVRAAPEQKMASVQAPFTTSRATQPKTKKPKLTVKPEIAKPLPTLVAVEKGGYPESESTTTTKMVDFLDSHEYVHKMMMSNLGSSKRGSNNNFLTTQPTVMLPSRPQDAWGASFGLVPPVQDTSSALKRLATTPLSSWFLSKGCANFVKQVHFSDDDNDSRCSDDESSLNQSLLTPGCFDKTSPKKRASSAKKNAFLESLTTQSNWRTWYGNVDLHNLLDPPLDRVPEKLRTHEVTPLVLPEPAVGNESIILTKKTNDLELLEADIRREKLRGSAFSDQLLMMLQGKTVSGKLLEEEYSPLLH
ncbi:Hypothetical protein PHPALM_865 [Phytophthora palmivora]|uniref:Uncharacterized protein n=1 Tax=Phytophthora palmivora TaxID=4796 RepID=A0A2P4YTS3_9STRA|nr:Hypothetical protein PHPALM_865 [Phytophthora palmivora]